MKFTVKRPPAPVEAVVVEIPRVDAERLLVGYSRWGELETKFAAHDDFADRFSTSTKFFNKLREAINS
jgi:hypothetical protein